MMDTGNNNQQIKFLFARLREQHEQQQRERREKLMAESKTTTDLESEADKDSASSIKSTIKTCAQSSCTDEKPSEPEALEKEVQLSPSQISPPLPLPFITFKEDDDCDEAEKLARARRIEVIMKLSAEAKAKEAERRRVANIRPLSWNKPTFDYPSFSTSTSNSSTTDAAAAASDPNPNEAPQASSTLGKRKARQEESSRRSYPTFPTSRSYPIPRQATEEEIQALVDFADTWFPPSPSKRRSTEKRGDDK